MQHTKTIATLTLALVAVLQSNRLEAQSAGPSYATSETRELVEAMVEAHGGMQAWSRVDVLSFMFFTKIAGVAKPWLSRETVEISTGRAYLDWPLLDAEIVWNGEEVWSVGWPSGPPPGFFTRLTYSFVTLPWLSQTPGARLVATGTGRLPNDDTEYRTVRMTFVKRSASIPGSYYDLYINPETHILAGVGFDIAHPGMVANPSQTLGPNHHVFEELARVGGLLLPVYYVSYGVNQRNRSTSSALHSVFDISISEEFDESRMERRADAVMDTQTMDWWASAPDG